MTARCTHLHSRQVLAEGHLRSPDAQPARPSTKHRSLTSVIACWVDRLSDAATATEHLSIEVFCPKIWQPNTAANVRVSTVYRDICGSSRRSSHISRTLSAGWTARCWAEINTCAVVVSHSLVFCIVYSSVGCCYLCRWLMPRSNGVKTIRSQHLFIPTSRFITAKLKKWTVILFVWHGLFLCIIHVSIYLFDCYCLKFYHIIIKHLSSFVVCLVDADCHWSWSMGGSLVVWHCWCLFVFIVAVLLFDACRGTVSCQCCRGTVWCQWWIKELLTNLLTYLLTYIASSVDSCRSTNSE